MLKETPNRNSAKIKSAPKNNVLLFAAGFILLLSLVIIGQIKSEDKITIRTGNNYLAAETADTEEERERGLSGRESLDDNNVMLFVFERLARYGIWMKDMKFPIDIVWLDADKNIVDVMNEVSPDTYPEIFHPNSEAKYVIEMSAGNAKKLGLQVGQSLSW